MSNDIARHYDASKHDGGFIPGVPLGDISQAAYDAYPDHIKQRIDESPLYRKSAPRAKTQATAKEAEKTTETTKGESQ